MTPSSDVLIYVQTVKNYFKTNKEASDYFYIETMEKEFFDELILVAQENFDKGDDPTLTIPQFEILKQKMLKIKIDRLRKESKQEPTDIFMDFPGFDKICLN